MVGKIFIDRISSTGFGAILSNFDSRDAVLLLEKDFGFGQILANYLLDQESEKLPLFRNFALALAYALAPTRKRG